MGTIIIFLGRKWGDETKGTNVLRTVEGLCGQNPQFERIRQIMRTVQNPPIKSNKWGRRSAVPGSNIKLEPLILRATGGENPGHAGYYLGYQGGVCNQLSPGLFHPQAHELLAKGVLLNPTALVTEANYFSNKVHLDFLGRVHISSQAYLAMPWHPSQGQVEEDFRGSLEHTSIGRGTGPAARDRDMGIGITFGELVSALHADENRTTLLEKIRQGAADKKAYIDRLLGSGFHHARNKYVPSDFEPAIVFERYLEAARILEGCMANEGQERQLIASAIEQNCLVGEGTQGALRDPLWGTWPYITKTRVTYKGFIEGSGLTEEVLENNKVIVVTVNRAFDHIHGWLPFVTKENLIAPDPTEWNPYRGDFYTGAYDLPAGRLTDMVHLLEAGRPFDYMSLGCLDRLSHLEKLKICTAYQYSGPDQYLEEYFKGEAFKLLSKGLNLGRDAFFDEKTGQFKVYPAHAMILAFCRPIYKEYKGWQKDISNVREMGRLPDEALAYINALTDEDTPQLWISVGPELGQVIPA